MGQRSLEGLYRAFLADATRMRRVFVLTRRGTHDIGPLTEDVNDAAAWDCVLQLHDAWARFCKAVVLLSAEGGSATRTGQVLPRVAGLARRQDAGMRKRC
jgi:hypothetical protein